MFLRRKVGPAGGVARHRAAPDHIDPVDEKRRSRIVPLDLLDPPAAIDTRQATPCDLPKAVDRRPLGDVEDFYPRS
jgi:hypothetical protein